MSNQEQATIDALKRVRELEDALRRIRALPTWRPGDDPCGCARCRGVRAVVSMSEAHEIVDEVLGGPVP